MAIVIRGIGETDEHYQGRKDAAEARVVARKKAREDAKDEKREDREDREDRQDREVVKKVGGVVRKLFEQDGDVESAYKYANAVGMDENNKRIMMIFKTQGEAAGFKALMTREDGAEMTYAESRARYG
jgi:beta-phosphoglucomutase-like phosphatase (HAD superfamily)